MAKFDAVAASITLLDDVAAGAKRRSSDRSQQGAGESSVIEVDYDAWRTPKAFNLTITDLGSGTVEEFDNVTMD